MFPQRTRHSVPWTLDCQGQRPLPCAKTEPFLDINISMWCNVGMKYDDAMVLVK